MSLAIPLTPCECRLRSFARSLKHRPGTTFRLLVISWMLWRQKSSESEAWLALLQGYAWPGNVRELRNTLESVIVMSTRETIDAVDFPPPIREAASALPLPPLIPMGTPLAEIEIEVIRQTLGRTGGNRTEASKILGVSTWTLQRRVKEHDSLAPSTPDLKRDSLFAYSTVLLPT